MEETNIVLTDDELRTILTQRAEQEKQKPKTPPEEKPKKNKSYSKLMMSFILIATYLVVFASLAIMWHRNDFSGVPPIINGTFALAQIAAMFYSGKALTENVFKHNSIGGVSNG